MGRVVAQNRAANSKVRVSNPKERAANSKPYYYSASQLSTFQLCKRKWAWEYIAGFRDPAGPAAQLGGRVHKVLEYWLKEARPPNKRTVEGKIAAAGLDELPLPSPKLKVEKGFEQQIGEFFYRGYIDLGFKTKDGRWIIDHKTTGDFIWQKTEKDLKTDIQAIMYARAVFERFPDCDVVFLKWVYYRTRNPAVRTTKIKLTRSYVMKQFEVIEALTKNAERLRLTVIDPLKVEPTATACSAYGGCPHIHRCQLKPIERMKAIMAQGEKKLSLAQRFRQRNKERPRKVRRVSAKPEFNPPEQPDEEEALSTEIEDMPIQRKKSGKKAPKKVTKKKAPPSRRRSKAEEEDEDEDDDDDDDMELDEEFGQEEPDDDEDEDDEEPAPKRRGRPPGSKTKKNTKKVVEDDDEGEDDNSPDARTKQLVWGMLHAGALAGGGSEALLEKAAELFKEFSE